MISKVGIDGYKDVPLCGIFLLPSSVNTDLKYRFKISAFSDGSVIVRTSIYRSFQDNNASVFLSLGFYVMPQGLFVIWEKDRI